MLPVKMGISISLAGLVAPNNASFHFRVSVNDRVACCFWNIWKMAGNRAPSRWWRHRVTPAVGARRLLRQKRK